MREAINRYLGMIRHRRGFLFAIALILLAGILCQVLAHTDWLLPLASESVRALIAGLGEALLIAAVLALLVDPVAQHQFATEWGRDLYWAIFSPHAPPDFREALQALAAPSGYITNCTFELRFKYPDD